MNAADALIELLHSDEADLRIQAALALGLQSGPEVVNALLAALDDADRNVRFHAIESLESFAPARRLMPWRGSPSPATSSWRSRPSSRSSRLAIHQWQSGSCRGWPTRRSTMRRPMALGALGDEDAVAPLVARLDERGAPVGPIVSALAAIHARYEETAGAADASRIWPGDRSRLESAQTMLAFVRAGAGWNCGPHCWCSAGLSCPPSPRSRRACSVSPPCSMT